MVIVTRSVRFVGRVQGVGFRAAAMSKARKLSVNGWVRNSEKFDTVEAMLQGEERKVDEFINFFKSPQGMIRVDSVAVDKINNSEKLGSFGIKY